MEKLIKLLNERIREKRNELSSTIGEPVDVWIYEYDKLEECITYDGYWVSDECIISKKEEFIEWLVNNDKIDLDMVREKLWIPCCVWYGSWRIIAVKDVEDYKQVLMLLSISDTPIEDLISYLK